MLLVLGNVACARIFRNLAKSDHEIQYTKNCLYLEILQGSFRLCREDGKLLIVLIYPIKPFS